MSNLHTDKAHIYSGHYYFLLKGQSGDNLLPYLVFIDVYFSHYLNALDENVNCIGKTSKLESAINKVKISFLFLNHYRLQLYVYNNK
jgi:hypothetical protein